MNSGVVKFITSPHICSICSRAVVNDKIISCPLYHPSMDGYVVQQICVSCYSRLQEQADQIHTANVSLIDAESGDELPVIHEPIYSKLRERIHLLLKGGNANERN